jgi:sulfite exporter TauE/SafE
VDLIMPFLAACRAVFVDNQGLAASLAVAGLVAGFGHCAGMCGPFVLAQTTARLADSPASDMTELTRLRGALLIPYHLGRMVTYAGLGSAAGLITGGIGVAIGLHWLSTLLLGLAALFFFGYGLSRLGLGMPRLAATGNSGQLGARLSRLTRPLFEHPTGGRGFALGLALGFLPCGVLYGAIAAAAASGSALGGAAVMAVFALATAPGLVVVGLAGHFAAGQWRGAVTRAGAALMIVNGGVLAWLAWNTAGLTGVW